MSCFPDWAWVALMKAPIWRPWGRARGRRAGR